MLVSKLVYTRDSCEDCTKAHTVTLMMTTERSLENSMRSASAQGPPIYWIINNSRMREISSRNAATALGA